MFELHKKKKPEKSQGLKIWGMLMFGVGRGKES